MGDFGTVIQINSSDELTQSKLEEISNKLSEIFVEQSLNNSEAYEFQNDDYLHAEDKKSVMFIITDHYYSGNTKEDEDLKEFIEEFEGLISESIIEMLKVTYPDYEYSSFVDEW